MQNFRFHMHSIWRSLTLWKNWKSRSCSKIWMMPIWYWYLCLKLVNKVQDGTNYCVHEKWWISIFKERHVLWRQIANWSSVRNSHGSESFGFRCCATPIIKTSMPQALCLQHIVSKRIILFMKIVSWSFQRKECFLVVPVPKFWRWFCENQGHENFVLVTCSFKAYCKLHRLPFS